MSVILMPPLIEFEQPVTTHHTILFVKDSVYVK